MYVIVDSISFVYVYQFSELVHLFHTLSYILSLTLTNSLTHSLSLCLLTLFLDFIANVFCIYS